MEDEMPVKYKIRIPEIDNILVEHNKAHVGIVSVNNTEEEKNELKGSMTVAKIKERIESLTIEYNNLRHVCVMLI